MIQVCGISAMCGVTKALCLVLYGFHERTVLLVSLRRFGANRIRAIRSDVTLGHDVGDNAISTVTNAMALACRSSDFLGRMGGDEAVGILKDVDEEGLPPSSIA